MTQDALNKVELPTQKDLVIVARKPATIHWGDVPGVDREDDEVIGELVVYDDETYDIVVNDDMSEDAKKIIYGFESRMTSLYSLGPKEN